jgi:hypothetical protein
MLYSRDSTPAYSPSGIAMKTPTLAFVILLLGATGVARADHHDGRKGARDAQKRSPDQGSITLQAPEIDSASMVAALTLLGGALAVMRGRRTLKPNG